MGVVCYPADFAVDRARLRRATAAPHIWRGPAFDPRSGIRLACLTAGSMAIIIGGLMLALAILPGGS